MAEFFLTKMGNKFYEGDVPRIARALERIADGLERQNKLAEAAWRPHNTPEDICHETGCPHPSHKENGT